MERVKSTVFRLFLCFMLESGIVGNIYAVTASTNASKVINGASKTAYSENLNLETISYGTRLCADCNRNQVPVSARKYDSSKEATVHSADSENNDKPFNIIIPDESVLKYSPQVGKDDDGFVPVPGPYGTKSTFSRDKPFKPVVNPYNAGAAARNVNSAYKNSRIKNHTPRHVKTLKSHQSARNLKSHQSQQNVNHAQDVQRRSQYRHSKAREEPAEKESIGNENILGNGNFEIIRGGIFSDQDANEIVGSRRMGRGYTPLVAPTYQRSRFNVAQNVHFPPIYQQRVQIPFNPVYFPRAPY